MSIESILKSGNMSSIFLNIAFDGVEAAIDRTSSAFKSYEKWSKEQGEKQIDQKFEIMRSRAMSLPSHSPLTSPISSPRLEAVAADILPLNLELDF